VSFELLFSLFRSADEEAGHQSFFDNQFPMFFPSLTAAFNVSAIITVDFTGTQTRQLGDWLDFIKHA
jgi:hypothetical protein